MVAWYHILSVFCDDRKRIKYLISSNVKYIYLFINGIMVQYKIEIGQATKRPNYLLKFWCICRETLHDKMQFSFQLQRKGYWKRYNRKKLTESQANSGK